MGASTNMSRAVLLVNDELLSRETVKHLFRNDNYTFIEAESPDEGIAILRDQPEIRVILLDLSFESLGTVAGTAILEAIKDRSAEYRVIVLTGHESRLPAERAGEYKIFNYLPKTGTEALRFSVDQAFKDLEREQVNRKLRLLLDVQQKISANEKIEAILDEICTAVRSTVGAYTCHIRVYDLEYGDYRLGGFAGTDEAQRQMFTLPKAKGDPFSGGVVETGSPANIRDLQKDVNFRKVADAALSDQATPPAQRLYLQRARSAYIIPITTGLFGQAVNAVINVSADRVAFFDDQRASIVSEFVTLAALTLTKAWLQRIRGEIHRDYSQISEMLNKIGRLKGPDVIPQIYTAVIQGISAIVHPEVISIFLYNELTQVIENVAEFRGGRRVETPSEFYRPGESLVGAVFKNQETIQLPDPKASVRVTPLEDKRYDHTGKEGYLDNIPSRKVAHYLGVPIRIGDQVRGVLRAMNKKSKHYGRVPPHQDFHCLLERGFSGDCRNALEITASHLAVAISNAELVKEKELQVEQLRSLGEVGRVISSALNIEDVLAVTIEQMAKVMQAEICMLFLRDSEGRIVLRQSYGMPMITGAFYNMGEGVTGSVAHTGRAWLQVSPQENDGKYDNIICAFLKKKHKEIRNIDSLMVVPIVAKDKTVGAMKVINKVGDDLRYCEADLESLQDLCGLCWRRCGECSNVQGGQ